MSTVFWRRWCVKHKRKQKTVRHDDQFRITAGERSLAPHGMRAHTPRDTQPSLDQIRKTTGFQLSADRHTHKRVIPELRFNSAAYH